MSSETKLVNFIRNKGVLDASNSTKYTYEVNEVEDGIITTLLIMDTSEEDGGLYTCANVENSQDILRNVIVGFPSEVMLNVTNVRILEVVGTEITLEWDPPTGDPLAEIQEYEIAYFKRSHEDEPDIILTKNESALLPFLEENTDYGFQVRVKTSMGWGAFSNTVYQSTGKHIEEDIAESTTLSNADEDMETTTLSSTDYFNNSNDPEKAYEDEYIYGEEDGNFTLIFNESVEYNYPKEDEDYDGAKELPLPTYEKIVLSCGDITDPED
ncbi:hypothetical protein SK128_009082, partial [Halocaridina rubra]